MASTFAGSAARPRPEEAAGGPARPLAALAGAAGRRAYLAGAAGCGMRGLVEFLLRNDWEVWGSDRAGLASGDPLRRAGLRWLEEAEPPPAVSLAVRSVAVPEAAAGFASAVAAGARALTYAQLLGEVTRLRPALAVAGSHGKTTCTGWIAYGLRRAGRDAGFLVGGEVPQLGGSAHWGEDGELLVVESCEYARSFHALRPRHVALINVDAEHPDTYPGGLPEVTAAFAEFLALLPAEGSVIAGPEAPELAAAGAARWRRAPELPAGWEIGLPGLHNRRNAALVAAVLRELGVGEHAMRATLRDYRGAARRLEALGSFQGARVMSDYAHHPVEVAATLQALREQTPGARLVVVFQPHQAVRFDAYRDAFAPALDEAGALLLLEIYRARDPEHLRPSVRELFAPLRARRPLRPLAFAGDFSAGERWLREWVGEGDLVVGLGAGDVDAFTRGLAG